VKPRLLDLFCGAGGCARGYYDAGFDVVGVDKEPQPNYPYEFHQADALEYLAAVTADWPLGAIFDVIHASPPCQRYIRSGNVDREKHPDLLGPTRELLEATGLPYVIENVPGAPMRADIVLCGSMFGLEVRRHRWFESNVPIPPWVPACDHTYPVAGVYGHPHGADGAAPGMLPGDLETWSRAMGIDWMTAPELANAIPPAYTRWIGTQLLQALSGDETS
jgi:DNA (cytosine-5)-methyltransferase 1